MSRFEAITQYENALKAGKKYYNNALSKGEDPRCGFLRRGVY